MNSPPPDTIAPLREFVVAATQVAAQAVHEPARVQAMRALLQRLVAQDDWLPQWAAQPHALHYQQYLLHCDPLERFCVVSFVWGPGQRTPVHDHTVWGLIGMLRGAETSQRYQQGAHGRWLPQGAPSRLSPGDVDLVSPATGDVHQVSNALADQPSISIHVYGGNIGAIARHVFEPTSGAVKPFVSGYSAAQVPNLWDRSVQVRGALDGASGA